MRKIMAVSARLSILLFMIMAILPSISSAIAPTTSILSPQEMASLKGQAGFYGYVYYNLRPVYGAKVTAWQQFTGLGVYSTLSIYNGYYSLPVPDSGIYKIWAAYNGQSNAFRCISPGKSYYKLDHYIGFGDPGPVYTICV